MIFLLFNGTYCGKTIDVLEAIEHLTEGEVKAYNHNEEQHYKTVGDIVRLVRFVKHTEEWEKNQ